ncbi:nulp1-pending protein [Grosmannia clavigera kw1407]|uniref:Nulp1-pending protein n=1 Tax=Grosmannia clavigera (strain kw1407 / UAMH 11150) TaxID=655863 RepID=F0X7H0_GROCL|nr:nulp1-pending protein [Grosmannia clavigera kw1407]EFX06564.1 nulp1-pending protein [Grosmannia clavigera kw1407]
MSSRQLKKLRAQEEQKRAALAVDGDADEASSGSEEENLGVRPRAKNAFAAFAALGGDDDGDDGGDNNNDDDDDDDDDNRHNEDGIERPPSSQQQAAKTAKPGKKKKKAKKKDKGGKTEAGAESVSVASSLPVTSPGKKGAKTERKAKSAKDAAAEDDGLDEIDRALKELNIQRPAAQQQVQRQQDQDQSATVLAGGGSNIRIRLNFHDLRVLNELRDVFGRDTIRAARADEGERVDGNPGVVMVDLETFLHGTPTVAPGMGRRAGAMLAAAAASQRGMTEAVARRNPFIEFKDTWARAPSGGLGMRQVTPTAAATSSAVAEYTFTHSPAYVQLDQTFFSLVMMHNHHPLIQFLKQNPYHIASLIQVSRVAKQDQNAALAADLCERALFSFGRATLSSFRQKLAEGLARLSFRRPENRQFLLAGYYYIKSLIPRGTHRTALAWVKLFLSVMPDDEYGLLLWGHALAIRASEERWLLEVFGATDKAGDKVDDKADDKADAKSIPAVRRNPMRAYIRQTLVVARLQLGDEAGARTALEDGLTRLPWLYGALFQALGLDVPLAVWGVQPRDDAEALYTQLYVQQARDLWESTPVAALLRDVAATMPKQTPAAITVLPPAEPVSPSIARFAYLDGTPVTMALVPGSMLHASPNYDFDPLPPPRALNIFSHVGQERPWIVAANEEEEEGRAGASAGAGAGAGAGFDAWGALDRFLMAPGAALDPGFGDEDDFDSGGDDNEDEDDETNQHADVQTSQEQYTRQRTGSMPGAWVEDVDDEEFL